MRARGTRKQAGESRAGAIGDLTPPGRRGSSLLQVLQQILERTYRMETGVREVGSYVIGDEGYRRFYGGPVPLIPSGAVLRRDERAPLSAFSIAADARVLIHDGPGRIGAHIYYPDAMIRRLEENPPMRGLVDQNIDEFAVFIEELDHFLLVAERANLRRPVSLLELELHANVTKYLVCALFLAGARPEDRSAPLAPRDRLWLLWHLFEKVRFIEPDPAVQQRYRDASRFARRFLVRLDAQPGALRRLALLRAFHDSTHQQKIASLA